MNEIFLDDKSIILTNVQENIENEKYFRLKDVTLDEIIEALSHKEVERIYLYHPKAEKLMKKFKQLIPTIKAGGGIVYNQEGKVLLIKRNGKWDLPKGKKEKGENIATCALREVEEETGVKKLLIQRFRTITYHIFKRDKQYFLKETYWYDMTTTYKKKLVPQTEEGIEKVCWKDEATAKELAKSS
ncbi:NUDIX hydrolase, partial [Capnocytophaga leadbetteri]